jgi:hypothetical protein
MSDDQNCSFKQHNMFAKLFVGNNVIFPTFRNRFRSMDMSLRKTMRHFTFEINIWDQKIKEASLYCIYICCSDNCGFSQKRNFLNKKDRIARYKLRNAVRVDNSSSRMFLSIRICHFWSETSISTNSERG